MPARGLSLLAFFLATTLLTGTASLTGKAWGQQSSPLQKKWETAHGEFLRATARVLSLTRKVQEVDKKKAVIQKKIDEIDKQPSSFLRDRERQNLFVELRTLLDENDYAKTLSELRRAETEEIDARDAALEAAWDYVPERFDRAERDFENQRQKPGEDKLDEAARVLVQIGILERHKVAQDDDVFPEPPPRPPEDPDKRVAFAKMCKEEAAVRWDEVAKITALCKSLEPERGRLARFVKKDYATGGRAQNMLELITARLESLERRRQAKSKTASQWEDTAQTALAAPKPPPKAP